MIRFRNRVRTLVDRAMNTAGVAWIARVYYAHHNARVLVDMEYRFGVVLDEATRGRMSKAHYPLPVMLQEISEAFVEHGSDSYRDGRADALAEHGIVEEEEAA